MNDDATNTSAASGRPTTGGGADCVVRLAGVRLRYGKTVALDGVDLDVPGGKMVGLIGPDGVGKSTLLSLVAGAHVVQDGRVEVLGGDISQKRHRDRVCPRIAYMPQGLGKNLYPTLSVEENLQFFARLFGHGPRARRRRIDELTRATGLLPFLARPAGKLSGGMKQKLGLCCSLIHDPDLLILDEPTTGVDPLARSQFWDLIDRVRAGQQSMGVMVATAYMDEARRFDWLVAMDDGHVLATGTPEELFARTGTDNLEAAFIKLLPEEKRAGHRSLEIAPLAADAEDNIVIEAKNLTRRFGKFTAVDHVNFRIRHGEIFGFLGSNGCGKTTTMKMLTGLLPPSEGEAWLFGKPMEGGSLAIRKNLGYMTQAFSLYDELTVSQNLVLAARLYGLPEKEVDERCREMMRRFDLEHVAGKLPSALPLGVRQRLSLAAAVVHNPAILILDEPTSGVDPVARDGFWELIIELSRRDRVTIFITTHFMNEAERCDRISLMHSGKSLACDTPAKLVARRGTANLEDAFIDYLLEAGAGTEEQNAEARVSARLKTGAVPAASVASATSAESAAAASGPAVVALPTGAAAAGSTPASAPEPEPERFYAPDETVVMKTPPKKKVEPLDFGAPSGRFSSSRNSRSWRDSVADADGPSNKRRRPPFSSFSLRRLYSCIWRESLELMRDPIRATLALGGSLLLLLVMGYGITMDVEDLSFAVLDRDDSGLSRNYALNISGSRYFTEQERLESHDEIDRRMRDGKLTMAVELPPGFGRDFQRGAKPIIGVWIDGAMPTRGETIRGYVESLHSQWLDQQADESAEGPDKDSQPAAAVETRFRYNPDVESLPSMVPAVIPVLLLMLPAILAALAVVREKEMGSIINLYVTPLTRTEFMLGKQLPYVVLALASFLLMAAVAVTTFNVPVKGSFPTLLAAVTVYGAIATGMGLLASSITKSQIAVMFLAIVATMLPAVQFSGLINPVETLEGTGKIIGELYPTTYMLVISRGVFNKALDFGDLHASFWPLLITAPLIFGLSVLLLKRQES